MKKILKSRLFFFILGAVIFGTGSVFAYSFFAQDVGYSPKDDTWEVDDVKGALDDLRDSFNDIKETDATASDILLGKKAYTKDGLITGTFENYGEIITYASNVGSGTTINVEIGQYIIVSSYAGANATNATKLITNIQGGTKSDIGVWTQVFRATGNSVRVTGDGGAPFSYIVIK